MARYDKMKELLKEKQEFDREQTELHDKHDEIPEDTVIVEKSSAVRATLSFIKSLGRTIAGVIFIILASIGLLTLIYPETRAAFMVVVQNVIAELKDLI